MEIDQFKEKLNLLINRRDSNKFRLDYIYKKYGKDEKNCSSISLKYGTELWFEYDYLIKSLPLIQKEISDLFIYLFHLVL